MPDTGEAVSSVFSTILGSFGLSVGSLALSNLVSAAVVLVVCLIAVRVLLAALGRLLDRSRLDRTLHTFIRSAAKGILYVLTAIIVLGSIGFNISSLVAALSVVGLAASLAMQSSLSNLAGGILLLITKPFSVGDYVVAGGEEGTVMEVGLVYTELNTVDNKRLHVPNSTISAGNIVNYSTEGRRRVDLLLAVSYDAPVDEVKRAVLQAVERIPQIVDEPEPFVRLSAYEDSRIAYTVRVWCANEDYWTVYFDLLEEVKRTFDANGIQMPYNHLNVHLVEQGREKSPQNG